MQCSSGVHCNHQATRSRWQGRKPRQMFSAFRAQPEVSLDAYDCRPKPRNSGIWPGRAAFNGLHCFRRPCTMTNSGRSITSVIYHQLQGTIPKPSAAEHIEYRSWETRTTPVEALPATRPFYSEQWPRHSCFYAHEASDMERQYELFRHSADEIACVSMRPKWKPCRFRSRTPLRSEPFQYNRNFGSAISHYSHLRNQTSVN